MDSLTKEQRSNLMRAVKGKNTSLERSVCLSLKRLGFRFRKNVRSLPGTPDIAFPAERVAIFLDGDFWHGYRLKQWKSRLTKFWREKLEENRARDIRNFRKLRYRGWRVLRFWGHEITQDVSLVASTIAMNVNAERKRVRRAGPPVRGARGRLRHK